LEKFGALDWGVNWVRFPRENKQTLGGKIWLPSKGFLNWLFLVKEIRIWFRKKVWQTPLKTRAGLAPKLG